MKIARVGIAALLMFCGSALAQNIYRTGEPEVLAAPKPQVSAADENAKVADTGFRKAYKAHKSPGIVVFWNRELTDTLEQETAHVTETTGSAHHSATQISDTTSDGMGGSSTLTEADGDSNMNRRTVERTVKSDGSAVGAKLDKKMEITLRSTFMEALRDSGAHLIDRTMMIRSTSLKTKDKDSQSVEMRGLESKARYLAEVVVVPDTESAIGCGFRVSIKDIKTSEELTEFYTLATPPVEGPGGFVPVPGKGFERARAPKASVQDYGRQLSTEVLYQFSTVL